jgi:ribosomal protein S18 acetylase RimI-like enzyme
MAEQNDRLRFRLDLIAEHHDVASFDCHNTYLSQFLREKAIVETHQDLSLTFVLLDASFAPPAIVGYFTLRADSYYPENTQSVHSIPVVELAYLARDITRRSQGIGDYLLLEALRKVKEAADLIGIAGLHLAYTDEGKKLYDRYNFGEHPLSYRTDLLFLSINLIRQIIEEANAEE